MSKISPHFDRSEFACKCGCGFDTVDTELLELLETVRQHFLRPVVVTSGCRCALHNAREGGSKNSQHLYGRAADFYVKDHTPAEVFEFLEELYAGRYGLGLYPGWVHADSRSNGPARW